MVETVGRLRTFAATYSLALAAHSSTHRPTPVHMHIHMAMVVLWAT